MAISTTDPDTISVFISFFPFFMPFIFSFRISAHGCGHPRRCKETLATEGISQHRERDALPQSTKNTEEGG